MDAVRRRASKSNQHATRDRRPTSSRGAAAGYGCTKKWASFLPPQPRRMPRRVQCSCWHRGRGALYFAPAGAAPASRNRCSS